MKYIKDKLDLFFPETTFVLEKESSSSLKITWDAGPDLKRVATDILAEKKEEGTHGMHCQVRGDFVHLYRGHLAKDILAAWFLTKSTKDALYILEKWKARPKFQEQDEVLLTLLADELKIGEGYEKVGKMGAVLASYFSANPNKIKELEILASNLLTSKHQ